MPKKTTKKTKSSRKTDSRVVQKKTTAKEKENRSEYAQVFNSFLKLKQGQSDYSDIVANALEATDNIFMLSQGQAEESPVK